MKEVTGGAGGTAPEARAGGATPLRVAIVGAGPAGFFSAAELLKLPQASVDLFDRLPAPYGLVRHGVAPDHPAIKSVTARYDQAARAAGARFRLIGNVRIGRDISLAELRERYHAVVLAVGAEGARRLGVPGEDLPGVHSALSFVGWYNGHPDARDHSFDLSSPRAVVVGVGNVALDVARILVRPLEELWRTDISDHALEALERRRVREVVLLGRGGPAQAAFTPPELAELARIEGCDLVISAADRALDPETAARRARGKLDHAAERRLAAVAKAREEPGPGAQRRVVRLRFWTSPVEIVGRGRVEGVRVRSTRAGAGAGGGEQGSELIPCGLVFRSIGYRVEPLAGVPYDEASGTIPHRHGQVLLSQGGAEAVPGLFVAGWAKRGPRGVIGSNKPDAQETVNTLLEAWRAGRLPSPSAGAGDAVGLLAARGVAFISYPDWQLLDQLEVEAGRSQGRPRRKFTDARAMLRALAQETAPQEATGSRLP